MLRSKMEILFYKLDRTIAISGLAIMGILIVDKLSQGDLLTLGIAIATSLGGYTLGRNSRKNDNESNSKS